MSEELAYVKCCEENHNKISFNDNTNRFYLVAFDVKRFVPYEDHVNTGAIEYCPWCGILLDTNLLEK